MRLSQHELEVIHHELRAVDPNGIIYLFGSRVLDSRKGGDIDIFFETTQSLDPEKKLAIEYQISSLCDTQLDLLIKTPDVPEKTIFAIARKGIRL